MLQALLGPIGNIATTFLKNKAEKAKAKQKLEVAKIEAATKKVQSDANWEEKAMDASASSWKDELWTLLFCPKFDSKITFFRKPIGDFGVHFTTFIPFLELLGLRTSISAFFGSASFLHSPCLKTLIDESNVATTGWIDLKNATQVVDVGLSLDLPSFVGSETAFSSQFLVSESSEDTNLGKFEW